MKRSVLTEASGVPIGLAIEGANRNDFKMVEATIQSIPIPRPKPTRKCPQGLCLDKGYDYDETRDLVLEFGYTAHIRRTAKKPRPSNTRPVSKLAAGSSNGPTVG